MNPDSKKIVLFHVDLDSPAVLARFWGLSENRDLTDLFYERGMKRAGELFREFNVPATFFCVGKDLEDSIRARETVREAHASGHEIANHTHSHPFSLHSLSEEALRREIQSCSNAIRQVTGRDPVGFRAPGYAIGGRLMRLLRELSFRYDSSAFWSPAGALMKGIHRLGSKKSFKDSYGETDSSVPGGPYFPDAEDWKREGSERALLEIPLPRSPFLLTPFYNNFHLTVPNFYRILEIELSRSRCLVYLFHLIEFCDMKDGLPEALRVHPNLTLPVEVKMARMRDTLRRLLGRHQAMRTDRFTEGYCNPAKG